MRSWFPHSNQHDIVSPTTTEYRIFQECIAVFLLMTHPLQFGTLALNVSSELHKSLGFLLLLSPFVLSKIKTVILVDDSSSVGIISKY